MTTSTSRSHIITAAAGGIGSELIDILLGRGENVFAIDISSRRLAALEERFADRGGALVTRKANVLEENDIAAAVAEAVERFGCIEGLANIAGGIVGIGSDLIDCDILDVSPEDFRKSFELNVDSAFMMTRALVPHFEANRYGKVVNVASMAAFGNLVHMGNPAYDPAKAAVIGLTTSLCRRLGPRGIRVNAVAPSAVFTDRVIASFPPEHVDMQRERAPLKSLVGPRDVANALDFLLSPLSDQISGELIRVAAGLQ